MRLLKHFIAFCKMFNKFNNKYDTLTSLKLHFWHENVKIKILISFKNVWHSDSVSERMV